MTQPNDLLVKLYGKRRRIIRHCVLQLADKLEGGQWYSPSLRAIFARYHRVEIGLYTHGGCFVPGAFDQYTTIGRYCSIAGSVRAMNRNHPLHFCSTHAFFFNPALGMVAQDPLEYTPLQIGSDVWIGHNAIIMPAVTSIGHGAVIAAGAVVNKDVPPYAIIVGNPARIVRYRFAPAQIERLLQQKWWEKPLSELDMAAMNHDLQLPVSA